MGLGRRVVLGFCSHSLHYFRLTLVLIGYAFVNRRVERPTTVTEYSEFFDVVIVAPRCHKWRTTLQQQHGCRSVPLLECADSRIVDRRSRRGAGGDASRTVRGYHGISAADGSPAAARGAMVRSF